MVGSFFRMVFVVMRGKEVCMDALDWDAFCSWLCDRESVVVGLPGMWFHDPLALYLSEVFGRVYGVDGAFYGPACVDPAYWSWLPAWAQRFSSRLQRYALREMTGAEVFAVLADVLR